MTSKYDHWLRVETGRLDVSTRQLKNLHYETINLDLVQRIAADTFTEGSLIYFSDKGEPLRTNEDYESLNVMLMLSEHPLGVGLALSEVIAFQEAS